MRVAARSSRILLVVLLVGFGCSPSGGSYEDHPSHDGLVHPIPPTGSLRFAQQPSHTTSVSPLNAWDATLATATLGRLDGPEQEVFGSVQDVAQYHDGRLLILDGRAREVRVFDGDGLPIQTLGGNGRGPGEFAEPRRLLLDSSGVLLVAEGLGATSVFEMEADTLRFSYTMWHEGDLWDACIMGGQVYIHGSRGTGGRLVHVYSIAGEAMHSFGEVYRTPNHIIRHQLSQGRIACVEDAEVVLLAPAWLPEVRAYSPAGELLWWLEIEGFLPLHVSETPTGGALMRFPERGAHMTIGLVPSSDGNAALLQIGRISGGTQARTQGLVALHTFVIMADRRTGFYAGDSWPRILHWGKARLIGMREAPHPEVIIFAKQGGPGGNTSDPGG